MKIFFATIAREIVPVLIMIAGIPLVCGEVALVAFFSVVILAAFAWRYRTGEWVIFLFGLCAMTVSEALFVATGVETFAQRSLFGLMPLWLPLLWAYGFVAIARGVAALPQSAQSQNTEHHHNADPNKTMS